MNKHHMVVAMGVGMATNMALEAGKALAEGESVDVAIEIGRHSNELMFGPYPSDTIDGKYYSDLTASVERFIRMHEEEDANSAR